MSERAEDPVVEVSSDDEPGYEVRADASVVGPVTFDQVRRGRESGRIPNRAEVREVGPWIPAMELLEGPDQSSHSMALEVRFSDRLFGPLMREDLKRVHGQGRVPAGAEGRWVSAWMAVDSLPAPLRAPAREEAPPAAPDGGAASDPVAGPAARRASGSGSSELPTRKLGLSPEERDAVVARLRFTGTPTRVVTPPDAAQPDAAEKRPASREARKPDAPATEASPPSAQRPNAASSELRSRLLALVALALAGTVVVVAGVVVGGLARHQGVARSTEAPVASRRSAIQPRPDAAAPSPVWSPCLEAALGTTSNDAEGDAGRPCAGGTLRTFRSEGEVLAVLDGLARSSATVAHMPATVHEVFPNLPVPVESYVSERVLVALPPLHKQPETQDLIDMLRLWDAGARVSSGCALVGVCRGATWVLDDQQLSLEMEVDAQTIRLRFVLRPANENRPAGAGQPTAERTAWPWRDELPVRQVAAHHQQLLEKLVEAGWYPTDAPAFLAAAMRAGFKDEAATTDGLWLVAAWLRHADEWGPIGRMLWSSCLETRARKLQLGDRAALETFLGADPDRAGALGRSAAPARSKAPPGGEPPDSRDPASDGYRAAIGTAAQVDCSFTMDTCRMAATGVPPRANRILRDAPAGQATMARRLICHPRFNHLLAEELRRTRAALIQATPSGATGAQ